MDEGSLFTLGRPDPSRPVLLTGLGAAAVLAATGDMALQWEARGALLEWGGIYAQGVRLTGPWRTTFNVEGKALSSPETLQRVTATRWRLDSDHLLGPLIARQTVLALPENPGVARRWVLSNPTDEPVEVGLESRWSPYLSPVIVEAFKPYAYKAEVVDGTPRFESGSYRVSCAGSPDPGAWWVNDAPWDGRLSEGEIENVRHDTLVTVPAGGRSQVDWVIWGGLDRLLKEDPGLGRNELAQRTNWESSAARRWETWVQASPQAEFPDAPWLERAYALARTGLRSLYTRPEPSLHGLVAGYPWYSTVWCRDLAWSLPAVLWMGDFDWATKSIESVLRFQAPENILILSAERGELPMQLSAGPVFIFGTSDTTHHYPDLVRRLLEHSGDLGKSRELFPAVERAIAWGRARVNAESHLVRNGGELERMMQLAKLTGRFEYGIDAHDTTIWDSVDRRDHAIDVQALWSYALRAYGRLAGLLEQREAAATAAEESARLTESVAARYRWPEEGYLFDSLRKDGAPVRKVRPNALRAVAAGLVPNEVARSLLARAQREDLLTAWGLRTLSEEDPAFLPTSYHDGEVWTIATAWGAEAAFALHDAVAGVRFLRIIADRILAEDGLANECYRGDRPEAFNSCFLLGFSVAPFLVNIFEGLWGLRVEAPERVLRVSPRFPPEWRRARLSGVLIGPGRVDLEFIDGSLRVRYEGPGALNVVGPLGSLELTGGSEGRLDWADPAKTS